jgi:glucuronosyltransferase
MYSFTLLLVAIESISCGRILGIFPTPFYSHQSVFQPIWRELAVRGHEVTVITTNPTGDKSLPNLKEIDLSFTYRLVFEEHKMQQVINTESNVLVLMKHVFFVMNNMTTEQLKHPEVQELIAKDQGFDLILVEVHVPAWFGFAKKYKCPVVGITSMEATNYVKRIMGNLNNPVYTPHFNLPFGVDLSLVERAICVLFELLDEVQMTYLFYPIQQKIIRRAMNDSDINLMDITKSISLLFTCAIPGFSKRSTNIPSIVALNGLQIKPPRGLPEELQQFLDGADSGAIYFSLGTNIKSYLVSKEKQKILMDVFSKLPFRVIWKFEDGVLDLPPNVKIVTWAPQQDILRHKNTKLFITQGGVQSIEEAIRFNVPLLGFPFFGDQFHNVKRLEHLQLGTWLDFTTLNEESLKSAILETINNDTWVCTSVLVPTCSLLLSDIWQIWRRYRTCYAHRRALWTRRSCGWSTSCGTKGRSICAAPWPTSPSTSTTSSTSSSSFWFLCSRWSRSRFSWLKLRGGCGAERIMKNSKPNKYP